MIITIPENYKKVPQRAPNIIFGIWFFLIIAFSMFVGTNIGVDEGVLSFFFLSFLAICAIFLVRIVDSYGTTLYFDGVTFLVIQHRNNNISDPFEFTSNQILELKKVALTRLPLMEIVLKTGESVTVPSGAFYKSISYGRDSSSFVDFMNDWFKKHTEIE